MKKQETLEEAAERLYSDKEYSMYGEIRRHSFIAGAESDAAKDYWFKIFQQDKNKYSEEEVLELWNWLNDGFMMRKSLPTREELIGWFEQFKKK